MKVGGNHGHGSLKFSLVLVNTKNPNSKDNILIAIANIKDSRENMEIIFESIRNQLVDVTYFVWEGKKVVLFGDFDFLHKMYGISGAMAIIVVCGV